MMMTNRWLTWLTAAVVVCMAVPAMADWYDNFADGELYGGEDPNDPNYDGLFYNGEVDPNHWDIDNTHWTIGVVVGTVPDANVVGLDRWLRLYIDKDPIFPLLAFIYGVVHYGDEDPNTSETWWDDTTSHYVVARFITGVYNDDPNADTSMGTLILRADPATFKAWMLTYEFADDWPWRGAYMALETVTYPVSHSFGSTHVPELTNYRYYPGSPKGYNWGAPYWPSRLYYYWLDPLYDPNDPNFLTGRPGWAPQFDPNYYPYDPNYEPDPNYIDPNLYDPNDPNWQDPRDPNWMLADANMLDPNMMRADPNWMDEHFGFWMCIQFEITDPNYPPGDPNGKTVRGSCWNGGKYDWDGTWKLEKDLSGDIDNDPDPNTSWWPEWYVPAGRAGVGTWGTDEYGFPISTAYDNFEARIGVFTNTSRALTLTRKDCTSLTVDPDILDEPNGDPNNPDLLRRYTNGTGIVLHSVVPVGNKSFKKWRIMGPNDAGDPAYQEVNDTNAILYLTMDGDYAVRAVCKCGGGGIEPFAGIVLLLLGLGVLIRRLT